MIMLFLVLNWQLLSVVRLLLQCITTPATLPFGNTAAATIFKEATKSLPGVISPMLKLGQAASLLVIKLSRPALWLFPCLGSNKLPGRGRVHLPLKLPSMICPGRSSQTDSTFQTTLSLFLFLSLC